MPKFAVKICKAFGLGQGQGCDAYVKLKLGRQEKRKTKIIRDSANPVWDEWFDYHEWNDGDKLHVDVWNANSFSPNEFLGQLIFDFPTDPTGHIKARLPLRTDSSGLPVCGQLELELVDVDKKRAYQQQHGAGAQPSEVAKPADALGETLTKKMIQGEDFQLFADGQANKIKLYWTEFGGPMGEIVWAVEGRDPSAASDRHRIAMHTVTDVFVGFPCPHSKHANPDLCLSLKGKTNAMDLIAPSTASLEGWLNGIKYILMSRGKKVVQDDNNKQDAGQKKKGQRLSIVGNQGALGAGTAQSNEPMFQGDANTTQLKMMLSGCNMFAYEGDTSPAVVPTHVFFSRRGGKFGSIYWCEQGVHQEHPDKCLLMHELTDIYVGKQQPIFKHPIAANVEDQSCFSVISKTKTLHVQAESVQVMKDWMVGINYVLTSAGRKVVLENESGEKKATPAGRRFSRHFSVAVRSKATHKGVLKMAKGNLFQRYRQKKSRPDRSVKTQVFVFHSRLVAPEGQAENKNTSSGALFWYEKKDSELEEEGKKTKDRSCMPIFSITDVIVGKQDIDLFQTKCACFAEDDSVITVIGTCVSKRGKEENFALHLEAEHPSVALDWIEAIQFLLEEHGKTVETEDVEAPAAEGEAAPKKGRRLSVVKGSGPPPPTGDDPFDMLGQDYDMGGFDDAGIDAFNPASRPENPFGGGGDETWDPFGGAEGGEDPFAGAADPFAGAGFDDPFGGGDDPFAAAPAPAAAASGAGDPALFTFLQSVGLESLAETFAAEEVTLETLKMMTVDDLKEMGIKAGPRVKIVKSVAGYA